MISSKHYQQMRRSKKILLTINQHVLNMKENTCCIDENVDCINNKINQTTSTIELQQETLMKSLPPLVSFTDEFI